MRGTLIVSADREALYNVAAEKITQTLESAPASQKTVNWALAGGRTPRPLYARLAGEPYRSRVPWERLHLFWGDERLVPLDHPDSNYRAVKETLLAGVPIPAENVHAVRTNLSAKEAAAAYTEDLRRHFRLWKGFPVFDLVLLGIGNDGHIASLFPHAPTLDERQRFAVPARSQSGMTRISLTLPVLNRARKIFLLAMGKEKADVVRRGAEESGPLPIQRVKPATGELVWLLDHEAAAGLSRVQVNG